MKARIETRTLGAILCAAFVALAISQAGASAGTQQENIPFSGVLWQRTTEGEFYGELSPRPICAAAPARVYGSSEVSI